MGNNFCDLAFASLGSRSKIAFKESFCKCTNFILPSYLFLSLDYEALQKRVHSLWKNFLQGGGGEGGRELIIIVNR